VLLRKIFYLVAIGFLLAACASDEPPKIVDIAVVEEPVTNPADQQYAILKNLFSTHLNSKDLQHAKRLINDIKSAYPPNDPRREMILLMEKYTKETIASRSEITSLNRKLKTLEAEVTRQGKALKDVRRSLMSQ